MAMLNPFRPTRPKRGKYKVPRHEVYSEPFKIDGVLCRLIPLTRGKTTIVNDIDYEELNKSNWIAHPDPYTGKWYAIRTVHDGVRHWTESMHRVILGVDWAGFDVKGDHIDLEYTLDNRRENLRVATHGQNRMNSRKQRNNTSGFKGVSLKRANGKFYAFITVDQKRIYLGQHETPEKAFEARSVASVKYHKEFSRTA